MRVRVLIDDPGGRFTAGEEGHTVPFESLNGYAHLVRFPGLVELPPVAGYPKRAVPRDFFFHADEVERIQVPPVTQRYCSVCGAEVKATRREPRLTLCKEHEHGRGQLYMLLAEDAGRWERHRVLMQRGMRPGSVRRQRRWLVHGSQSERLVLEARSKGAALWDKLHPDLRAWVEEVHGAAV